jgi:hypothetical protein
MRVTTRSSFVSPCGSAVEVKAAVSIPVRTRQRIELNIWTAFAAWLVCGRSIRGSRRARGRN